MDALTVSFLLRPSNSVAPGYALVRCGCVPSEVAEQRNGLDANNYIPVGERNEMFLSDSVPFKER